MVISFLSYFNSISISLYLNFIFHRLNKTFISNRSILYKRNAFFNHKKMVVNIIVFKILIISVLIFPSRKEITTTLKTHEGSYNNISSGKFTFSVVSLIMKCWFTLHCLNELWDFGITSKQHSLVCNWLIRNNVTNSMRTK